MTSLDLSPLYRHTVGFDRIGRMLDHARGFENNAPSYPPYNIEVSSEDQYAITLALAGFSERDIDIEVEGGELTVRGSKAADDKEKTYLHRGIANRSFERKFKLADHVEVTDAGMENGILTIQLLREVPEAMKPRKVAINGQAALEQKAEDVSEEK